MTGAVRLPLSRAAGRAAYDGAGGASLSAPPAPALAPGPGGRLHGNIAVADHEGVAGWVIDQDDPSRPVALEIVADGIVVAACVADRSRPDLEMAGLGGGRCGFAMRFRRPLPAGRDRVLQIRRTGDGADVPGSPLLLAGRRGTQDGLAAAWRRQHAAAADDAARHALATLLARHIDRLVQARIGHAAASVADAPVRT